MADTTKPKCQKIKYKSREEAKQEERVMRKRGRVRQRPYACDHEDCKSHGYWHLSTNPKTDKLKGGRRGRMDAGDRTGDTHYRTTRHKPRLVP